VSSHSLVQVSDLEAFLPDVWKALGDDSKTARVFKAIHQNIIFIGIYHLKKAIPNIQTRWAPGIVAAYSPVLGMFALPKAGRSSSISCPTWWSSRTRGESKRWVLQIVLFDRVAAPHDL
jgi:hypothetical protein